MTRRSPFRAPVAMMTATAALLTLSGCMTVHGELAVIPAVSDKADAGKAVKQFVAGYNEANAVHDPEVTASYETGALQDIDEASIKVDRQHGRGFQPLKLSDTKIVIPKMAGWPKFFLADARSNKSGRWLLAFTRNSPQEKWKAAYLLPLPAGGLPQFATDKDGYAKAIPAGEGSAGLTIDPGKLGNAYAKYLKTGSGDLFAPGPHTDRLRQQRTAAAKQVGQRTETIDQAYKFPAMALRTKDGGALAFFATRSFQRKTLPAGHAFNITPEIQAVLDGPKKQTNKMTFTSVSEQMVKVPAKKNGGQVAFLQRLPKQTAAKAE
ncbi:hypothetical protein [Streptomyces sp. NPDC042319]|uniref:hypothetical protein n=1 Tax=Streptomyces sp. NPDC042319 TaxID=3154332 RepID=UPI0033C09420